MNGPRVEPARFRARARTLGAVLAAMVFALGLPSSARATATGPATTVTTGSPITLELDSVSAPALTPGSRFTLTATLRNGGGTPVTALAARLRLDWARLGVDDIAAWADRPDDAWAGTVWATTRLPAPLAPGAAVDVSLSGDADYLGLPRSADAFGPRGLAVEVVGDIGQGVQRLAMQRTFVVWDPGTEPVRPVRLAMIAPITSAGTLTGGGQPGPRLLAEWSRGGRLDRVLRATADPAFAWAIDPSLLTAAQAARQAVSDSQGGAGSEGTSPTLTPTAAQPDGAATAGPPATPPSAPSATGSAPARVPSAVRQAARIADSWESTLLAGASGRDLYTLPWGDPDLAALAHAGAVPLLSAGQDAALAATSATFGTPLDYTLAWPVSELADGPTVDLLARTKDRTVLLSRTVLPVDTVAGRISLPGTRDDVTALVSDPQLDAAIAAMAGGGGDQPLVGAQRALAVLATYSPGEAAVGTGTQAEESPGLVAAIPRGWDPTRPERMSAGLALLRSAPWIHVEPLGEARGRDPKPPPSGAGRVITYPQQARAAELPTAHVTAVDAAYRRFLTFLPALHDPNPVFLPLRHEALSLVSSAWRASDLPGVSGSGASGEPLAAEALTEALKDARGSFVAQVQGFFTGVSVATGSAVNLLTQNGSLPVTVTSTLPFPLDLTLMLRPTSGRLVAGQPQPVFLAAADPGGTTRANVLVEVTARANGDVDVIASLWAPDGTAPLVTADDPILVRVRHDWESRGLLITGAVLGLLVIVGLVRGARRGRTRRIPPESVPDPDDIGREPARSGASRHPSLRSDTLIRSAETAREPAKVARSTPAADVATPVRVRAGVPGRGANEPSDPRIHPGGQPEAPEAAGHDARRDPPGDPAAGPATVGAAGSNGTTTHCSDGSGGTTPASTRTPSPTDISSPADTSSPIHTPHPGGTASPTDPPSRTGSTTESAGASDGAGRRGESILRSSALMSAGTLVSRILGLARVVVLSAAIGAAASGDAFNTANTLPNTLFILIGGGALNAVLVPQIVRAAQRPDRGAEYVDRLLTLAILVLGGATVLLTAAAPLLIRLYSKDWSEPKIALGTAFALWCLPQTFFYGLYTLYGQVLNARGSFGPYMWAPVVNNVVAIAGMGVFIAMAGAGVRPVEAWSAGDIAVLAGTTTLGVVAQALVLVPVLRRSGYTWRPRWGWRGVGLREAGSVASWTFAGVAIAQLGFVIISRVVNAAGDAAEQAGIPGGRTVFDFAFLIFMLPHSLITVSVVTALFTRMSAAVAATRYDRVREDLSQATRTVAVVTVFATAAFVVLGSQMARALFVGTDRTTTDQYAFVATMMLLGLVPYSAQYLFQRVFYAFADARTPFLVGALGTALWTTGALIAPLLVQPRDVAAVVGLALTVSTVVTVLIWLPLLRRRLGSLDAVRIAVTHLRLLVAAVVAGGAGVVARDLVADGAGDSQTAAVLTVAAATTVMAVVYLVMLRVLRVRELDALIVPLRARLLRR